MVSAEGLVSFPFGRSEEMRLVSWAGRRAPVVWLLFALPRISEGTRRKRVSVFGVLGRNVTGKLIYPGRGDRGCGGGSGWGCGFRGIGGEELELLVVWLLLSSGRSEGTGFVSWAGRRAPVVWPLFALARWSLLALSRISEGTRRKRVSLFGVLGRNVTGKLIYPGRGGVVRQNLRQSVACFSLIVIFASM